MHKASQVAQAVASLNIKLVAEIIISTAALLIQLCLHKTSS